MKIDNMFRKLERLFFIFCVLISPIAFSACSHIFYAANPGHTLALEEKGDLKVQYASINENESSTSGNQIQIGYSPKQNIGIQVSYYDLRDDDKGNGFMAYAGLGTYYYKQLGQTNKSNSEFAANNYYKNGLLLDAYGSFGTGKSTNIYTDEGFGRIDFKTNQYAVQGGAHLYFWRVFKIGLSNRVSLLDFRKAKITGKIGFEGASHLEEILQNDPFLLNEIIFDFSIGIAKLNAFFQASRGFSNKQFRIGDNSFSIGFNCDINDFYKKNKPD